MKGIHLEGLRALGRPEDFAAFYYAQGADELIFQDTVASLYERNSLTDVISRTAKDIFIPLTVGGGIRTLEDISNVLRAGADKVAINTAAIQRPDLINEAASMFGSSTIIVAIEASRQPNGTYLAFTDNGREHTGVDVIPWIEEAEKRGAGEILLTSIDKEGTRVKDLIMNLRPPATQITSIPVITHGGAAKASHIQEVVVDSRVDAVAIASMLHYPALTSLLSEPSTNEGNSEFLKSQKPVKRYGQEQLSEIKKLLKDYGLSIREVRGVLDVAILDYQLNNLHSVEAACRVAKLRSEVTNDPKKILAARAIILPGVGAFGEAMTQLIDSGLDACITEFVGSGRPFLGICLGFQLLFDRSEEFGNHKGLGLISGSV